MRRSMRKLVSLLLVGFLLLTTGGVAFAAADEVRHELAQTEPHAPSMPGEKGQACDGCCACHYSSHLFTVLPGDTSLNAEGAWAVVSPPPALAVTRPIEAFFRPPRIS